LNYKGRLNEAAFFFFPSRGHELTTVSEGPRDRERLSAGRSNRGGLDRSHRHHARKAGRAPKR